VWLTNYHHLYFFCKNVKLWHRNLVKNVWETCLNISKSTYPAAHALVLIRSELTHQHYILSFFLSFFSFFSENATFIYWPILLPWRHWSWSCWLQSLQLGSQTLKATHVRVTHSYFEVVHTTTSWKTNQVQAGHARWKLIFFHSRKWNSQ
jgi:hypothetical protein